MTLGELKTLTSVWLDDTSFGYFTESQIKRWLNNAQYEVQKMLILAGENLYVKKYQTSTVANQSDYVLPQEFAKLHRIEIITNPGQTNETTVPVLPCTINQQDLLVQTNGYPDFYFLRRQRIQLIPRPDAVYTLRILFSYKAAEMSLDTDQPDIPEEYQEMLAVLATIDGFLKDRRDPSAMVEKRMYYEALMKRASEERRVDWSRQIVSTTDDYSALMF